MRRRLRAGLSVGSNSLPFAISFAVAADQRSSRTHQNVSVATQNEEYKSVMTGSILYYCPVRAFLGRVGARPGDDVTGGASRPALLVVRVGLCGEKQVAYRRLGGHIV